MKNVTSSKWIAGVLVAMLLSMASYAKGPKVVGTWNYSAPYAPYEYSEGQIIIEEAEGELAGKVKIDSYEMKLDEVKLEGDVHSFTLYVVGEYVSVKLTFDGNKFEGNASTSEGPLKVTGEKAK